MYKCVPQFNLVAVFHIRCVHSAVCFDVLQTSSAGKRATEVKSAWAAVWVILLGLAMAAGGGYMVYKYRLRVSRVQFITAYLCYCLSIFSGSVGPYGSFVECG